MAILLACTNCAKGQVANPIHIKGLRRRESGDDALETPSCDNTVDPLHEFRFHLARILSTARHGYFVVSAAPSATFVGLSGIAVFSSSRAAAGFGDDEGGSD